MRHAGESHTPVGVEPFPQVGSVEFPIAPTEPNTQCRPPGRPALLQRLCYDAGAANFVQGIGCILNRELAPVAHGSRGFL